MKGNTCLMELISHSLMMKNVQSFEMKKSGIVLHDFALINQQSRTF